MQLGQLKIRNFRVIKEASVTFSDKVVGIVGPNGAGKSSLIEAIAWAFYGNQSARSGREEIQSIFAQPNDWCEVSLSFFVHEQSYRVIRRLHSFSNKGEVKLFRGDSTESLGIRETDKFIRDLLGLDWKGFSTSFMARQQELSALSDIPTPQRRDHLAGMLGIERLDRAIKKVKEEGKLAGERIVFFERQLTGLDGLTIRLQELTKRVDDRRRRLPELTTSRTQAEQQANVCSDEIARMQELQKILLVKREELDAWRRTGEELAVRSTRLAADLVELEQLDIEAADLQAAVALLPELIQKEARFQEQRVQFVAYSVKQKQRDELQVRLGELQKKVEALSQRLTVIAQELLVLPFDSETAVLSVTQQLEQERQAYSEQLAMLSSLRNASEKMDKQLANILQMGSDAVCDRCLRPMGNDHAAIIGHLNQERQEIVSQITTIEQSLAQRKSQGEQLRDEKNRLELAIRSRYQLVTEQQSLQHSLDELIPALKLSEQQLAVLAAELQALHVEAVDINDGSRLQVEIAELRKKSERLQHTKGKLERRANLIADLQRIRELESTAQKQRDEIEQEIGRSVFTEERFSQLRQQLIDLQKKQEEARSAHELALRELEVAETDLRSVRESLDELAKVGAKLESERDSLFYGKKLDGLFSEFRKQLIAGIRPALAELSSQLMGEMTEGRYGRIELDADYNLQVMDYGKTYGIDRFSGGEKDLANLCLRLAISLALTESAGLNRSFIILDEVFGSQDDGRKELILRAMGNLKQRFPQILLVTHIEDIKGMVEETIEIVPTGYGWSEVKQIGAA